MSEKRSKRDSKRGPVRSTLRLSDWVRNSSVTGAPSVSILNCDGAPPRLQTQSSPTLQNRGGCVVACSSSASGGVARTHTSCAGEVDSTVVTSARVTDGANSSGIGVIAISNPSERRTGMISGRTERSRPTSTAELRMDWMTGNGASIAKPTARRIATRGIATDAVARPWNIPRANATASPGILIKSRSTGGINLKSCHAMMPNINAAAINENTAAEVAIPPRSQAGTRGARIPSL